MYKELKNSTIKAIEIMRSWEENDWKLSEVNEKLYNCYPIESMNLSYKNDEFQRLRMLVFTESTYSKMDNEDLAVRYINDSKIKKWFSDEDKLLLRQDLNNLFNSKEAKKSIYSSIPVTRGRKINR